MVATVREVEVFPICIRELDVLRVEDITPGMRRVIVGGPSMDRHVRDGVELPPVRTRGFDDDVKILPVDPATGTLPFTVPVNSDNGTVDWPTGSFQYSRTYTVRRFDEDTREMALDFAMHEGGLAADWAFGVQAGEKILIAGPKHSSSSTPANSQLWRRRSTWQSLSTCSTRIRTSTPCFCCAPSGHPPGESC